METLASSVRASSSPCLLAALVVALTLALTAPTPVRASGGRDDCAPGTRHARAEYEAEHERSRHLAHLDCAGLTAYSERFRQCYNQHIVAGYLRPIGTTESAASPRQAPATAPAPGATPTPPVPPAPAPRP